MLKSPTLESQSHALEAITEDTLSFMRLLLSIINHPQMALISLGPLPSLAMYVSESYLALEQLLPNRITAELEECANQVRALRYRAKLLDHPEKPLSHIAADLASVAEEQKKFFIKPHTGWLGPVKRAIQPDLSLYLYDGHIFSNSHVIVFNFGKNHDLTTGTQTVSVGEAIGKYTKELLESLGLPMPSFTSFPLTAGRFEMRDIKAEALYRRGVFGRILPDLSLGLALLLATLNNIRHIMQPLLPAGGHTQFRLKFIAAYHADSNFRAIQNQLAHDESISSAVKDMFREVLGNTDSRWLRKQAPLRHLLVHYLADEKHSIALPSGASRTEAIEHFAKKLSFSEMDALLDKHIARMAKVIEQGFDLDDDSFWYGRVV